MSSGTLKTMNATFSSQFSRTSALQERLFFFFSTLETFVFLHMRLQFENHNSALSVGS